MKECLKTFEIQKVLSFQNFRIAKKLIKLIKLHEILY